MKIRIKRGVFIFILGLCILAGRDHSAQASVSISDMKTAQARHLDMEVSLARK